MEKQLNKIFEDALIALKIQHKKDSKFISISNRPDLCDYQSNIAFGLAKELQKSPTEIAQTICNELKKNSFEFSDVSVAGNGFINMKLSDDFLASFVNELLQNSDTRVNKNAIPKTVIMDFGGYNIGKELHLGHLRSTIIAESVARIYRIKGDHVISDVHLGDWGKPMGLIITEIRERGLTNSGVELSDLQTIYPTASERAKNDSEYNNRALQATYDLQTGDADATKIWKQFTTLSIESAKKIATILGANFDVWYGESNADKTTKKMVDDLKKNGDAILDNGAYIIPLTPDDTNGKKLPPVIIEKTNGGIMYASTDMGTIIDRISEWKPDEILYFTDDRQSLHFEQVFAAVYKTKIADKNKLSLQHLPFGTVCGEDGKPLKSRDGDAVKLSDAINAAIEKGIAKMSEKNFNDDEKKSIGTSIGISCLKFADLMNDRTQNYIFNLDKATASEGKTAAYILYSIVRINSILNKSENKNFATQKITTASTLAERKLQLELIKISSIIDAAYTTKKPHILCEYLFELAQIFNTFYAHTEIINSHENIATLTKQIMELTCHLIGITPVEKM
ncbi:MAG: arginine--tRNA ligase [Rickettsiales bacterium]|jgi:arginyl-tRNA synthetase|nr:arginine--tRNA ligase [Rickettsiales bacterium]